MLLAIFRAQLKPQMLKRLPMLVCMLIVSVAISGTACRSSQEAKPDVVVSRANPEAGRLLGQFKTVDGTNCLMAPINPDKKGEYYDSSREVHNYVFYDTASEFTRQLLPTNDYLIATTFGFPERREGEKEIPHTRWFLYGVVKADTDEDKKLSSLDRNVLAVSDACGDGYTEIVTDVEQVFGHALRDENTLVLIYRKNSKKYVSIVDLTRRSVTSTKELPSLGADLK